MEGAPPPPPPVQIRNVDSSAVQTSSISSVQLKKVTPAQQPQQLQPQQPQQASTANDHLSKEEKERIIEKHFEVNMDRWAHLLPPSATIPVYSLPLTVSQARAIMDQSKEYDSATFSEDSLKVLQALQDDLEKVIIEGCGGADAAKNVGCFVKLSSRSPKDVLPSPDRLKELYEQCLEKPQGESETDKENKNRRLSALYEASIHFMKVHSAKEAIDLLLRSRRIMWDLSYDLESPEKFSNHIIVRPWVSIPLRYEFRCFVYNDTLTAISQYYSQYYFPGLAEEKESLREKISNFWQDIHHLFPFKPPIHYVIDFALVEKPTTTTSSSSSPPSSSWDVVVLELNPFNFSTSGCLFNWESETDNDILEGKKPFEFRVRPEPIAHSLRNKVPSSWIPLLFDN